MEFDGFLGNGAAIIYVHPKLLHVRHESFVLREALVEHRVRQHEAHEQLDVVTRRHQSDLSRYD